VRAAAVRPRRLGSCAAVRPHCLEFLRPTTDLAEEAANTGASFARSCTGRQKPPTNRRSFVDSAARRKGLSSG
jgi:hypothetical protein